MDLHERISINPKVCPGEPCLKGTRIMVSNILAALAEGLPVSEILQDFPGITTEDVFEMRFTDTGLLFLNFTGVNHLQHLVPPLVEKPLNEKLNVRLKLYEYNDDLRQLKIIGEFNDFDFGSARLMARQVDGTYAYEMETTAATFAYQILGAEKSGHSINGTQSDGFVYDNGGDS